MCSCSFFFFNDTATTEIYTLSLHDALPIFCLHRGVRRDLRKARDLRQAIGRTRRVVVGQPVVATALDVQACQIERSEEHTSELQSPDHLVCRLLLEKKKERALKCHTRENSI